MSTRGERMTEETWNGGANPGEMIDYVNRVRLFGSRTVRSRKLRLLGCAAVRLEWDSLPDDVLREAVAAAELFADRACDLVHLGRARLAVAHTAHWLQSPLVEVCYELLSKSSTESARCIESYGDWTRIAALARDIFGNPFRPVACEPAWRTSTTTGLAAAMYEARSFANLPILADALEEAGCDHPDVLAHCRDEAATHVRGCWVVDLVLGKG